jgi:VanZ family protein
LPDSQRDHAAPRESRTEDRAPSLKKRYATGKRVVFGLLALSLMALLFWMSARTSLPFATRLPMPKGPSGNLMHVLAFAVLGVLLGRAFDPDGARPRFSEGAGRAALLVAALYGVFDEVHQFFTVGRTCSVADVIVDALGALGALLLPHRRDWAVWSRWLPGAACFAAAAAIAITTGVVRLGPDRWLEEALLALGLVPG